MKAVLLLALGFVFSPLVSVAGTISTLPLTVRPLAVSIPVPVTIGVQQLNEILLPPAHGVLSELSAKLDEDRVFGIGFGEFGVQHVSYIWESAESRYKWSLVCGGIGVGIMYHQDDWAVGIMHVRSQFDPAFNDGHSPLLFFFSVAM